MIKSLHCCLHVCKKKLIAMLYNLENSKGSSPSLPDYFSKCILCTEKNVEPKRLHPWSRFLVRNSSFSVWAISKLLQLILLLNCLMDRDFWEYWWSFDSSLIIALLGLIHITAWIPNSCCQNVIKDICYTWYLIWPNAGDWYHGNFFKSFLAHLCLCTMGSYAS